MTSAPEGTVTTFTRDAGTGALGFAGEVVLQPCIANTGTTVRLAAGDSITWVACFTARGPQPTSVDRLDLIALSRDAGLLTQIDDVTQSGFLSGSDLALAPDERQLYFGGDPVGVAGGVAAALLALARIRPSR